MDGSMDGYIIMIIGCTIWGVGEFVIYLRKRSLVKRNER